MFDGVAHLYALAGSGQSACPDPILSGVEAARLREFNSSDRSFSVLVLERVFTVKNTLGLHARPAAMLAQLACRHKSHVRVCKGDMEVNGKSVMGLMMLAAECGSKLRVVVEGEDEERAMKGMEKLFARKFDEE
ncbi:MAG: HPr family phosphocarrier protein [Elusimicrobia bacterium]|nr:HPr family phosphocarrier protein [Elusimicrobiota bacterium]